jgi:uncharacterized protein (DUF4415 family)
MADPHKAPRAPGYVQNPHYTQEDWDEVSDSPELTEEELAKAKPFAEVFPDLAKSIAMRGPQKAATKVPISIRLAPDVLAALKATGPGWQSRVSELLRKALRPPRAKRTARGASHKIAAPARRA